LDKEKEKKKTLSRIKNLENQPLFLLKKKTFFLEVIKK